MITLATAFLYGGLIEFLQGFTGRNPDFADLAADAAGALAGIGLFYLSQCCAESIRKKRS